MRVFLATQTQWLRAGLDARPVGLSYPSAEAVARGLGLDWPAVYPGLALMESEALRIFTARAEQEKKAKGR